MPWQKGNYNVTAFTTALAERPLWGGSCLSPPTATDPKRPFMAGGERAKVGVHHELLMPFFQYHPIHFID